MSDVSPYLSAYKHKTFSLPSTGARSAIGMGFTSYEVNTAKCMIIQTFTQNIRMTYDGTTPTATIGSQLAVAADPVQIYGTRNIVQFLAIAETGTAVVQVDLFK
jgi:hypothetical protein